MICFRSNNIFGCFFVILCKSFIFVAYKYKIGGNRQDLPMGKKKI